MSNDNNRGGNNGIDDMVMRDLFVTLKTMQQQFEGFGREMMNMRGDLEEVKQSQHTGATQPRRRGARQPPHVNDYI